MINLAENALNPIRISPNPVQDLVRIEYNKSVEINRSFISNSVSQIVVEISISNLPEEIDIGNLPSGVYFLTLQSHSGNKTVKLLKE